MIEARDLLHQGLLAWRTKQHLHAAELAGVLRKAMSAEDRQDTVVCLLIDQSGSMRGQKALYCTAAVDVCQAFLAGLGMRVEVLGFTTVGWQGGRSRRRWASRGRPRNPGRLNDLLHIIYREADDRRTGAEGPAFDQMLRPDLYKENIDGEALLWAAGRLRDRPERRKVLVVISDGAPVDDSTLLENDPACLHDHLIEVVAELERVADIELGAVGVGFDARSYYSRGMIEEAPEDIAIAIMGMVSRLLQEAPRRDGGLE